MLLPSATLFDDLFGADTHRAEGAPELADDALYPEEYAYIRAAVPKRRAEFTSARLAARRALVAMGLPPTALVPGPDRAPIWPDGVVGSISHTHDYCAVVLARTDVRRSVGLDVEIAGALDPSLYASIMTQREQRWLRAQSASSSDDFATLLFSAKEAFYKGQYPVSRSFLDFLDVELEIDAGASRFEARVLKPGWPSAVSRLSGRFAFRSGKVLCGVECPA